MPERNAVVRFVAGAIGEPGDRVFVLQFTTSAGTESYVVEKGQVARLVHIARELLRDIGFRDAGTGLDTDALETPDEIRFRVGEMRLEYSEDEGRMVLHLVSIDADASAVYTMTPTLLDATVKAGAAVVAAGRPPCPRCGLALDKEGHACPRDNGDLREHRA